MKELISQLYENNNAQVLLLATISIIFILLTGATLLSASAFTAYEQEQSVDTTNDAFDQLVDTEYAIETSVNHVNHATDSGGYNSMETQINDDIPVIENRFSRLFKTEGGDVVIESNNDFNRGIRVWRPRYGNLTRSDGAETYTVITDGNAETRGFTITNNGETNGVMRVILGRHPDVDIDTSGGQVTVSSADGSCTTDVSREDPAKISFTQGEINGIHCEALPKSNELGTIQFQNTDNIEGALNIVSDGTGTTLATPANPSSDPSRVEGHDAIYSTTVYITSITPETTLRTEVEVAPQLSVEVKQ